MNEGNIQALTRELLEYLKLADAEFRPDLTAKICLLVQRFAPSKQWQFDTLLEVRLPSRMMGCRAARALQAQQQAADAGVGDQACPVLALGGLTAASRCTASVHRVLSDTAGLQILLQAGAAVKEEVTRSLLVLLTNAPELQPYVSRQLYAALARTWEHCDLSLIVVASWWLGAGHSMCASTLRSLPLLLAPPESPPRPSTCFCSLCARLCSRASLRTASDLAAAGRGAWRAAVRGIGTAAAARRGGRPAAAVAPGGVPADGPPAEPPLPAACSRGVWPHHAHQAVRAVPRPGPARAGAQPACICLSLLQPTVCAGPALHLPRLGRRTWQLRAQACITCRASVAKQLLADA